MIGSLVAIGLGIGGSWYWFTQSRSVSTTAESTHTTVSQTQPIEAEVFRTPTCGCCGLWIDHAQTHGFVIGDRQQENITSIKEQYSITPELASCHTTIAEGFVFEGHIPAAEVRHFLANPPAEAIGLTVPGMPIGSPGMEMANKTQPYDVLALNRDGSTSVFASYE
ncbi:protein of unknown function DUF411 [[Leptolyngbya] sp. PCC 7376]|nr:protein of unknown function DUF411 [[Leptolyngbya] sp. PCC 7376]